MIKDLFGILVIVKCKCDKSCDVGKYSDYENCKFKKKKYLINYLKNVLKL